MALVRLLRRLNIRRTLDETVLQLFFFLMYDLYQLESTEGSKLTSRNRGSLFGLLRSLKTYAQRNSISETLVWRRKLTTRDTTRLSVYAVLLSRSPSWEKPSFAYDMWSNIVLFGVLQLCYPPFIPRFEGGILSDIVNSLGRLPEQWKGLYTHPKGLDS